MLLASHDSVRSRTVIVIVLASGCGAAPRQVDSLGQNHGHGAWDAYEEDTLEAVRASAEEDLHCPRERIRPFNVPNRSSLWYWYFADGCARRATYVQVCEPDTCRYLLVATVRLEQSR